MRPSLRLGGVAPLAVAAATLAIVLASTGTAFAGARDLVVCYPGEAGTTDQAKATMAEFAAAVARAGGLPPGSLAFTYFPDEAGCRKFLAEKKPGFAILSPDLYLEIKKERPLHPIAQSEQKGKTTILYHLFVKADAKAQKVEDLEGQTIATTHASDPAYAARVLLGGKLERVKFEQTNRPLQAIKSVIKGEQAAVLLDDIQVDTLPKATKDALREVYVSGAVPTAVIVAIGEVAPLADREAVKKGFLGLAPAPENRKLLETLRATGFRELDAKAYDQLEASLSNGPVAPPAGP